MAIQLKTIASYPLTGTRDFVIPFEYLARKFIVVTLTGPSKRLQLALNTDYRFATKTLITTNQAFTSGEYTQIEIRRFTSASDRLVNFSDGSILRAGDLNLSAIQSIHIAEEARDLTFDLMGLDNEFNYDAKNHKIVNLADGSEPQDAVNHKQLLGATGSAGDSAERAEAAAILATTARDLASVSAIQAVTSAATAVNAAQSARSSADAVGAIIEYVDGNWYHPPVVYKAGLEVTDGKFTVALNDLVFFANPEFVPFTTAQIFNPTQWFVFSNISRQELEAATGASLIGTKFGITQEEFNKKTDERLSYLPSVKSFGALCDGITDDTVAVRAYHQFCNLTGTTAQYTGQSIALQANAQIPVMTDVDFNGIVINIIGGIEPTPTWGNFNTLFIISDPDCPFTTITGTPTGKLTEGSLTPTKGLFDGHGFALLTSGFQIPARDKVSTMNYTQSFKVHRDGICTHPVSTDLSAYPAVTIGYRKTSVKRLVISGLSLNEGLWNNQRILHIQRCNVAIVNTTVLGDMNIAPFNNICELISIENASDVTIDTLVATGRQVSLSIGSYVIAINGGADIDVIRVQGLTGWGAIGANNLNGIRYSACTLNRVDCHSSGHNISIDDCVLNTEGVIYGWGGGYISISNSTFYSYTIVKNRVDYGGSFFGIISINECRVNNNGTVTYNIVDLARTPLGASTAVHAPFMIEVIDCIRLDKSSTTGVCTIVPVTIAVQSAAAVVYSPRSIKIDNIRGEAPWRMGLILDVLNLTKYTLSAILAVIVTNCRGASSAHYSNAISVLPSLGGTQVIPKLELTTTGVDNVNIMLETVVNPVVNITDCTIGNVACGGRVSINSSYFFTPATLLTGAAQVGGANSGPTNHTTLRNCMFGAAVYDLSKIAASIGTTINKGTDTPVLPVDSTATTLFTGWRKLGVFLD